MAGDKYFVFFYFVLDVNKLVNVYTIVSVSHSPYLFSSLNLKHCENVDFTRAEKKTKEHQI